MSSAGHIADMLVRLENNRALLKQHRRYADIIERYAQQSLNKPLEWKSLEEKERTMLIDHLKEVLKRERRNTLKAVLLSVLITLVILMIMASLFRWVFM